MVLSILCHLAKAQTFDIRFTGVEDWERVHSYSITDDNTVLLANTLVDETYSSERYQVMTLDLNGDIINSRAFGTSDNGWGRDVLQDSDGNIYFLGFSESKLGYELYKFNSSMDSLWLRELSGDLFNGDILGFEDRLFIIRGTYPGISCTAFDFDGNQLNGFSLSNTSGFYNFNKATKALDGHIFLTGFFHPDSSTRYHAFIAELSLEGDLNWLSIQQDSFNSNYVGVYETTDGSIFISGTKTTVDTGRLVRSASLTKYDPSGQLLFERFYDNGDYLEANDLLIHKDIIYMLCTTTSGVQDIMLIILDSSGAEISRHNLGDNRNSTAQEIKMINDNQLLIVGTGVNTETDINLDLKFIKVSGLEDITDVMETEALSTCQIYPNPVRRHQPIHSSHLLKSACVYDVNGHPLMSVQNTLIIDTTELPSGIYFLLGVTINNEILTEKIIIVD